MYERRVKYFEYYDIRDRIINLNFYDNFLSTYKKLTKKEITKGESRLTNYLLNSNGTKMESRLSNYYVEFRWDDDMLNYCTSKTLHRCLALYKCSEDFDCDQSWQSTLLDC